MRPHPPILHPYKPDLPFEIALDRILLYFQPTLKAQDINFKTMIYYWPLLTKVYSRQANFNFLDSQK